MKTYEINSHNEEVIVFLNPMGTDINFWKNCIPEDLINLYHILLIDYPGFNSEFIQYGRMQGLADAIHTEVISKITKPMHFFGYSYGGMLTQLLLNNIYENLLSVILVASSNNLTPRDKEIVTVLRDIISVDMYLFCRALTVFSQPPAAINENPLLFLQSFSNIKTATQTSKPLIQQMNHILNTKKIDIRNQQTPALVIFGESDKLLECFNISDFSSSLYNLKILRVKDQYHILDLDVLNNDIVEFLKSNSYDQN
jgi:pimeloyl-ACP methyl ester carboxylesterase